MFLKNSQESLIVSSSGICCLGFTLLLELSFDNIEGDEGEVQICVLVI